MSSRGFGEFASSAEELYVEDVFSTWLYTGNGSTQTITNGIDLSNKGGMVWLKTRGTSAGHRIYDTLRGWGNSLSSDNTFTQSFDPTSLTSFTSNGFTVDGSGDLATNTRLYVSWTFRKAPKFFDVVTYTGNGSETRMLNHNLGVVPGMVIIKPTSTTGNWMVTSRTNSGDYSYGLILNFTNAQSNTYNVSSYFSATQFNPYIGNNITETNASGVQYVAYLFAHDTTADGIVQCGSFTTNASNGVTNQITLGWEPQYLLLKNASSTSNWVIFDVQRGLALTQFEELRANSSNAAAAVSGTGIYPTATGFRIENNTLSASHNWVYLAIRRGPMRTPTDATKVFLPTKTSSATGTVITTNFPVDMQMVKATGSVDSTYLTDRLRGLNLSATLSGANAQQLKTDSSAAESATTGLSYAYDNRSFKLGGFSSATAYWSFRRAPGFFDVVCYTGTGSARTVSHNLGVAPELMIVKCRSNTIGDGTLGGWWIYHKSVSGNLGLVTAAIDPYGVGIPISPSNVSKTGFDLTASSIGNYSGYTYVAYLFASAPGVSKVGTYTGSGTTKQIDCGFTAGARFVLIKRTDSTGSWYVWDSARGIVAGNDPYLLLNSTAAEVTSTDYVDTYAAGFEISSTAPAAINASGGSYIFLAIA